MADGISPYPPQDDTGVWYREDRVRLALQQALEDAIETHGNASKAFAWDVNARFKELMR